MERGCVPCQLNCPPERYTRSKGPLPSERTIVRCVVLQAGQASKPDPVQTPMDLFCGHLRVFALSMRIFSSGKQATGDGNSWPGLTPVCYDGPLNERGRSGGS
jgi:hypothetical protein